MMTKYWHWLQSGPSDKRGWVQSVTLREHQAHGDGAVPVKQLMTWGCAPLARVALHTRVAPELPTAQSCMPYPRPQAPPRTRALASHMWSCR